MDGVAPDRDSEDTGGVRARVAAVFESSDTAAQLIDEHNRVTWTSPQLRIIAGLRDDADLAEGQPVRAASVENSDWSTVITGRTADVLARALSHPPDCPIWEITMGVRLAGEHQELSVIGIDLRTESGRSAGTALVYSPRLPAQIITMLSRGEPEVFERMAMLAEPAARPAAVVFVDIDSSAQLSRRLPTRAYFEVIRAVTTAVDRLVAQHWGVVGKHAGDGASAFFLATVCGSESAAARSALSFALELPAAVHQAVTDLAQAGMAVSPERCRVNVGAHWGASLYMGQVVTGGRLEVTALGDEVNETARIEQGARGGEILASKALLERLDPQDAAALGLDSRTCSYDILGDRVEADSKIQRDAGSLAVTSLVPVGGGVRADSRPEPAG